jgi:hypothetical protein
MIQLSSGRNRASMNCVEHSIADEQKMLVYRFDGELERETWISTFKGGDNLASFNEASGVVQFFQITQFCS